MLIIEWGTIIFQVLSLLVIFGLFFGVVGMIRYFKEIKQKIDSIDKNIKRILDAKD